MGICSPTLLFYSSCNEAHSLCTPYKKRNEVEWRMGWDYHLISLTFLLTISPDK